MGIEQPHASFHTMREGTADDWSIIAKEQMKFARQGGKRVLEHMKLLANDYGGYSVDRLQHCLQTATRAHRDGRDDEYIVMALLHDIGDTLGAYNHQDIAAAIMKPFISEENLWIVEQHGIFQGYYFFEYVGLDRDLREKFRGHPHFEACADFCEKYDQSSFDPNYDNAPLSFFEPLVMQLFERPKRSIYKDAVDAM